MSRLTSYVCNQKSRRAIFSTSYVGLDEEHIRTSNFLQPGAGGSVEIDDVRVTRALRVRLPLKAGGIIPASLCTAVTCGEKSRKMKHEHEKITHTFALVSSMIDDGGGKSPPCSDLSGYHLS